MVKKGIILILDSDSDNIEYLKTNFKGHLIDFFHVDNITSFYRKVSDKNLYVLGTILNPLLVKDDVVNVITRIKKNFPSTPISFVNNEGIENIPLERIGELITTRIIPENYELKDIISNDQIISYRLLVSKETSPNKTQLEEARENGYIPIDIKTFLLCDISTYGLYVRISRNKYIKLVNPGDGLPVERIIEFLQKGTTHIYIEKIAHFNLLKSLDALSKELFNTSYSKFETKQSVLANYGEVVERYFSKIDLSNDEIVFAYSFVDMAVNFVTKLDIDNEEMIEAIHNLISNIEQFEHGVATTFISGILCHKLKIIDEEELKIISLAAFLHDLGMVRLPQEVMKKDPEKMSREELALYHSHPTLGYNTVMAIEGFPEKVAIIIQNHHERIDGSGYPKKLSGVNISINCEVVGITEEFVDLVRLKKLGHDIEPIEHIISKTKGKFTDRARQSFLYILDKVS